MQKKFIIGLLVTLGITYPTLGAQSTEKTTIPTEKSLIMVEFNSTQAKVAVLPSNNLRVEPVSTDKMALNVVVQSLEGTPYVTVKPYNQPFNSPSRTSFGQQKMAGLILQSPSNLIIHADITNVDPLVSTQCYHDIHNGGYIHAANSQTYVNSTFGLAANGCVKLNPQSNLAQQIGNTAQLTQNANNPLAGLLNFGLAALANHSNQASALHQSTVQPKCAISSILLQPYSGIAREIPVVGTLNYGAEFTMNLSTLGAALEFVPNPNFEFMS